MEVIKVGHSPYAVLEQSFPSAVQKPTYDTLFPLWVFFLHFGVPDPKHNPLNTEDLCGVCCPLATYFS